jgi:hypothetical protein
VRKGFGSRQTKTVWAEIVHTEKGMGSRSDQAHRIATLGVALGQILGGGHDLAGDIAHVFAGMRELTSQEFRLNAHRFLKIGGMNQLSRMLECRLHVLLSE